MTTIALTTRLLAGYDNKKAIVVIGPRQGRQDIGALFENFFISEKMKQLSYNGFYGKTHYWRNFSL